MVQQVAGVLVGLLVIALLARLGWYLYTKNKGTVPAKSGLIVLKEDVDAVMMFSTLRRIHHYVDTLPEDAKAKGHEYVAGLMQLVGMPPEVPEKAPVSDVASNEVKIPVLG